MNDRRLNATIEITATVKVVGRTIYIYGEERPASEAVTAALSALKDLGQVRAFSADVLAAEFVESEPTDTDTDTKE